MENQVNSKNIIINYGLLLGLISIFPSLIKYAMGTHLERDWISSSFGILITIVIIILGIKKAKETNNGIISWSKALKVGMGITLISVLITILYMILFSNVIEPDFKMQAIEKTKQGWIDAGMTDEAIEQQIPLLENYFNLSLYGSIVVLGLVFGFVISAIAGAIMKKSEEDNY